ncbi:MAG: GNAT family N-acetyltransferase [Pyrinomonadaceae bacterium]|nr:GNAT family N-acetyltransferase [Pyrinomonadaceae bacterium]
MDGKNAVTEIRKAGPDDAKIVASLGIVTFYEAYFEQDTPADMAEYLFDSFSLEQIEAEIADANCDFYLIFRDGKAVGYAKMLRGSDADGLKGSNPIELKRIYLVERVWGTGLGEELLNFCVGRARESGHDTIWLGVWQENARGQSFYAKHGFEKVGTITFPYGDTVGINDVMERAV